MNIGRGMIFSSNGCTYSILAEAARLEVEATLEPRSILGTPAQRKGPARQCAEALRYIVGSLFASVSHHCLGQRQHVPERIFGAQEEVVEEVVMGMMTAFYKQKPTVDTPYRQLTLEHKNGWKVRLLGGDKWGPEHVQELKAIPGKSFDDCKESYDKIFGELQDEGWKAYSPF